MQVKLKGDATILINAMQRHLERRLRLALGASSASIRSATVRLADVNGPRGGVDQKCALSVELSPAGLIQAEAVDVDAIAAFERAAGRAGRAVRREIERRREAAR
jgi:ribosome-associated translation inhibitor RaiA